MGCQLPRRPKCRHLVLPSVAPPRRPPCAVPTRPARCVSGFWTRPVHDEVVEDLVGSEEDPDEIEEDLDVLPKEYG